MNSKACNALISNVLLTFLLSVFPLTQQNNTKGNVEMTQAEIKHMYTT